MDLIRSARPVNLRPRPPDQALLPLRFVPMMLRRHGVREAHSRPLVGRRLPDYRIQSWRSSPAMAWLQPLVEWPRTPLAYVAIALDVDGRDALERLAQANMGGWRVPKPNFCIHRTVTGNALAAYTLCRPVLRRPGAKPYPLAVLARIAEWLAIELGADAGYTGVLAANPSHDDYETAWLRTEGYSLDELRSYIPQGWRRPKPPARTDVGRNHDVFKALMRIAGSQSRSDREIAHHAVQIYREIDVVQPHAFSTGEMCDIVRSVIRYRDQWRQNGWHTDDWLKKQSICGSRNKPEQQRQKGVRSGQARRERVRERDIRILARLAAGESTRQVAADEGVNQATIARIPRRLGVMRELPTQMIPLVGFRGGRGATGPRRADASRSGQGSSQGTLPGLVHEATTTDPPPRGRWVESPRQPVTPPVSGSSRTSTLPVQGCLPGIRD